ncbi:hypothetical protein ACH41H_15555 [Streptomyces sp. NPDC020800]|uniref:hypothetical protein n=1 Tax=Streptomyces sp. NPDC020800 TaxID=3365092 RepID=UPI003797A1C1
MVTILTRAAAAAGAADSTGPLAPKAAAGVPDVTFGSRPDPSGDGTVWAKDRSGEVVAEAHWQSDPGGDTYPKGDTLYVSDYLADGIGARGEASVGIRISTGGAGDRVHRTKDVAEGTRLYINLCMTNSTGAVCSPGLAVHA